MHLRHYSSSCNIDNFLGSVQDWYIKHIASTEDHTRYMYSPFTTFDTTLKSHVMSYKRHALSDSKCFDSMFFPRKTHIVKMVDDFMYKRGKYSKRGFPHKLGILLHGAPGTGKTSFIKSLAEHTGRNIVNVRLSQVATNDQLMNIMYDQTFAVAAGSVRLAFASTIFVLEDIDAASDVVASKSEEVDATNTSHLRESGPVDKDVQQYIYKEADALNLAGVLNVLDGVVDSPGRIIVMTSNYPEKLDAALIRPGRIDHKILMDYMTGEDACSLVQHYFDLSLTAQQTQALTEAVDGCTTIGNNMEVQSLDSCEAVSARFSPAQLEQWCAEYDNVDDYVQAVVAKAQMY
jgi:mitochondrial chaperone BCS1